MNKAKKLNKTDIDDTRSMIKELALEASNSGTKKILPPKTLRSIRPVANQPVVNQPVANQYVVNQPVVNQSKQNIKITTKKILQEKKLDDDDDNDGDEAEQNKINEITKDVIVDEIFENNDDDNLDISDDDEDDNNRNKVKKNKDDQNNPEVANEFKEKVLTYVRCDDLIRKMTEEIKELKGQKKPCEDYIIKYLENKDASFINIKNGKLTKNKSETKGSLKADIIRNAIVDGIKDQKLDGDETKSADITTKIMDIMENKRPKTIRTNLKRTFQRKEKAEQKQKQKIKK